MSVAERTREIGIKRAIGGSRLRIIREFVAEAGVIGFLGGLIGLGAGWHRRLPRQRGRPARAAPSSSISPRRPRSSRSASARSSGCWPGSSRPGAPHGSTRCRPCATNDEGANDEPDRSDGPSQDLPAVADDQHRGAPGRRRQHCRRRDGGDHGAVRLRQEHPDAPARVAPLARTPTTGRRRRCGSTGSMSRPSRTASGRGPAPARWASCSSRSTSCRPYSPRERGAGRRVRRDVRRVLRGPRLARRSASVGLADRAATADGALGRRAAARRDRPGAGERPELILGDEPTGNLDSARAGEVLGLLRRFNRERGQTVLLVTHDAEVGAACDRIIRMRDGRIVADERVTEMEVAA